MKFTLCLFVDVGVLRRNKVRHRGLRNSFNTQLKLMFICFLFLSISMKNIAIRGEGFFTLIEVNSSLVKEEEDGTILCIQDDLLYLLIELFKPGSGWNSIVKIIGVQQPENPIVAGSYEFEGVLLDFKISESIAYMLIELPILAINRFFVETLNITDPTNPVQLGTSAWVSISTSRTNSTEQISTYKNYVYVSSDNLTIFDCSDPTLPVIVSIYPSTGGKLHVKNDFLYLVSNGIKIYNLTNPLNPVFLGEVNSTKQLSTDSEVYGDYAINAFEESGIECYNCTDPTQPTICCDYEFPQDEVERIVHDIDIEENRLFAGGNKLCIFNISDSHNLTRTAMIYSGNQDISQIKVSNDYIYLTIRNKVKIYILGVENPTSWIVGLENIIELSILVGAAILIVLVKRKNT